MAREFDRNMFVMLLAIMVGVIIITYFVADIMRRAEIENLTNQLDIKTGEIETITANNINFTNHFMKSSVLLDSAREDRAFGDYHFDLALLWYDSALSSKNASNMDVYKNMTIDNLTNAMEKYLISHQNYKESGKFFDATKAFTTYDKYLEVLNLYVSLTQSGARLTMLRYNASKYLIQITENITFINNTVTFSENVSELMEDFNFTMSMYDSELETYEDTQEDIDEYDFFDEIR